MSEPTEGECCGGPSSPFQVDAVVTVDERGQILLPKDVRSKAGIQAGDKLAVVSWEKDGEVCCLSLVRTDALLGMVKDMLGPMAAQLLE